VNWIRSIYDWVLKWADRPSGSRVLFIIAFAEASFFPIPPDVLLIPLALGMRKKAFKMAAICSVGSILGAFLGYSLGYFVWWTEGAFTPFAQFFFQNVPGFSVEGFYRLKELYETWNFWVIFTAGFTPIPFKLFTISAGAFHIQFPLFILASVISRSARFFLVAALIWKFGEPIRHFIDRYFNVLAIIFTILLVGGVWLIKYFI
jgi:membrane protein YqaA with SNARE-associated domain